jgi:hypothetical protein
MNPRRALRAWQVRRRVWAPVLTAVALALTAVVVVTTNAFAAGSPPPTPNFAGIPVEGYASVGPHACLSGDPHLPGVERFRDALLSGYPSSRPGASWAPCGTHAPNSDHHTGRAFDWHPGPFGREPTADQKADGDEIVNWLLQTVDGTAHMRLRRLGIAYVIWYNRIWSTSNQTWRQYDDCTGTSGNVTSCHRDHVHFSFGTAGADAQTSWWRGGSAPSAVDGVDVVTRGSGWLDVFGRDGRNRLVHKWYANGGWSGWEDLGGTLTSDPAAVSWSRDRLDVFARGGDNQLVHKWFTGGRWSGWEDLGGSLQSEPAVVSWGVGRLDVFALTTNGRLQHMWFAGGRWSGWEDLGGALSSAPTATTWGERRLDVFGRGASGKLMHIWFAGERWSGWEEQGSGLTSTPDALTRGQGWLDVFARGANNRLIHKWFANDAWSGWEELGGTLSTAPAVASWGRTRVDVFAVDGENRLVHKWYTDGRWSGWEQLGQMP